MFESIVIPTIVSCIIFLATEYLAKKRDKEQKRSELLIDYLRFTQDNLISIHLKICNLTEKAINFQLNKKPELHILYNQSSNELQSFSNVLLKSQAPINNALDMDLDLKTLNHKISEFRDIISDELFRFENDDEVMAKFNAAEKEILNFIENKYKIIETSIADLLK